MTNFSQYIVNKTGQNYEGKTDNNQLNENTPTPSPFNQTKLTKSNEEGI